MLESGVEKITSGAVMAPKGSKFGQLPTLVTGSSLKLKGLSDGGKCKHCGNARHTSDSCFKLHGYPEWWDELRAKKKRDIITLEYGTGKAVLVTIEFQLSLILMTISPTLLKPGNCGQVLYSYNS